MASNVKSPKQALNPAFLKQKPERKEIELFKKEFIVMLDRINLKESEEFHKNLIKDFLNAVYYKDKHYINTRGRADLVIHNGNNTTSSVGVLIEAKSPVNKAEMVSHENLNVKSFQELVLYYLRERKTGKNFELHHLIITNIYEWFVFDAQDFEKLFYHNKTLLKHFEQFQDGKLSGTNTDFFYKEIAAPEIQKLQSEIPYTHFDIRDYEEILSNSDKEGDRKLIALYKFLSPVNLLKLSFANDSNQLNREFYAELLHIIGLEEIKQDNKKLIVRKKENERDSGSIIENAISAIDSMDKLDNIDSQQYGEDKQERLFNVALDLAITWINRVLFLKLLEAQIIKYHKGNLDYSFLSVNKLNDYGELNNLFFSVLACKENERNESIKLKYAHIPYLNSSLFEKTDMEDRTIFINNLQNNIRIKPYSRTILRDVHSSLKPLEYLLQFLDAYDFSSEGSEDIQEENKTLISASVLGLIFEKINGYKDGSFFTPSFITMYMCRETISRAVIQKFNEAKNWNCKTLDDLTNHLGKNTEEIKEANNIFNSLRICDPAVGSGHFLVSALNEMVYIKSKLGILSDKNYKTLKDYRVSVENDELIITDNEGTYFTYNFKNIESQQIQEAFFHEKQTIIENCLFGVDINPNSVKICQLRLWIELLKHTFYRSGTNELETLPNIDINIKCGNSLISRFDLQGNYSTLPQVTKQMLQRITKDYKEQVSEYKKTDDKTERKHIRGNIERIKDNFDRINNPKDVDYLKWQQAEAKLKSPTINFDGDEDTRNKQLEQLQAETDALREKYEQKIKTFYSNAFEWSFEFPEVLDDDGNFVGFDVVIGNPPYIDYRKIEESIASNKNLIISFKSNRPNLYQYFIERGDQLLKSKGFLSFINPNQFLSTDSALELRKYLLAERTIIFIIDVSYIKVFREAATYPVVWSFVKNKNHENQIRINSCNDVQLLNDTTFKIQQKELLNTENKIIPVNPSYFMLLNIESKNPLRLKSIAKLKWGTSAAGYGKLKIKQIDFEKLSSSDKLQYKPILQTADTKKYYIDWQKEYIPISIYSDTIVKEFEKPKIVIGRVTKSIQACLDFEKHFVGKSTIITDAKIDLKVLLCLLNSSFANKWYFLKYETTHMAGGYLRFDIPYLEQLPIPKISKEQQQPIIALVNQILSLKKENPAANTSELEKKIDKLVYGLYELSDKEIEIVEGK